VRCLEQAARAAFDARLDPASRRPLCVAYSGGGDSLALLLIADAWARDHGRDVIVQHVDHRLQPASADWADACRAVAERLGRPFEVLRWTGDKPATGLPAAARAARHALLADAARQHGAAVILMGHTADDLAEGAAMREAGSTTPDPRAWRPSPAWPEGRGVFLLRPLLGAGRAELRAWLQARGETWIDDPANADARFARARARMTGVAAKPLAPEPAPLRLADQVSEDAGVLTAPRALFGGPDGARLLAMACVCAGGGSRLPRGDRVERLLAKLRDGAPVITTLAGARIEAGDRDVRILREAGEAARGGLRPSAPPVWDGRFERLDDGVAMSLVGERFRAAAGLVEREPA
jgi:tRNA(Ile)-lysidine synthase